MIERIVLIGGSAGSITSVIEILEQLPDELDCAICVTIHISPEAESYLPQIFSAKTKLRVMHAASGQLLKPNTIYVARPDHHLLINEGRIDIVRGAKENHHRPSIDPMFRSGAASFGRNVLAILLSGYLDDGTAGLVAVRNKKGQVLIQDPRDTAYPDMIINALEFVEPDIMCPVREIAEHIIKFSLSSAQSLPKDEQALEEANFVRLETGSLLETVNGPPSVYVCPDCSGPLWELNESPTGFVRFRCHEGHSFSSKSLVSSQLRELETALWTALRIMDEKVVLTKKLLERALEKKQPLAAQRYRATIERTESQSKLLRDILAEGIRGI